MNTKLDKAFEKIEKLHWLPWVGKNYFDPQNEPKLIIVGDSHYAWDEGSEDENDGVRLMLENTDFTRQDVNKYGMLQGWWKEGNKIQTRVKNLEKTLSIESENANAKRQFWERVCYFNILQKPLKSRSSIDRPPFQDFLDGWDVFYEVLDVLKPSYCLFNGVDASKHFYSHLAKKFNYISEEERAIKLDKIDACYPRKIILNKDGNIIKIIFLKHTSRWPFSPKLWGKLIDKEFPGLIDSYKD